jgi:hypothetical protein
MSRNLQRIVWVLVGLIPFLGIAAMVYYNVDRELPIYEPVTIQTGIIYNQEFVAAHTLLQNERAAVVDWMVREKHGWKKSWSASPLGKFTLRINHRTVEPSVLSVIPGFAVYECEQGYYFKKLDETQMRILTRLIEPATR